MSQQDGKSEIKESDAQRTIREEWEARPTITPAQLLEMFSPSLIDRIDKAQRELLADSVKALMGFTALAGATKDEDRLINIAGRNSAGYDDTVEDLMYEDEVLVALIDPEVRAAHKESEAYTQTARLRRTVVAHQIFSQLGVEVEESQPAEDAEAVAQEPIEDAS